VGSGGCGLPSLGFGLVLPSSKIYISHLTTAVVIAWPFSVIFFLHMQLRSIIGQPDNNSIIISRVKLRQTTTQLGKREGFDNVGHHLGLTIGAQISVCKAPSLSTGPAGPQCP